ncbi:MAG: ExbD/TolR family protein [Nannocystaceae bacterium]
MPRKKKNQATEAEVKANMLPVMNIMFLLIPALLMAMEFASMAAINVAPPKFTNTPGNPPKEPPAKSLNLKVVIHEDGFELAADGEMIDKKDAWIALANPSGERLEFDRYDYKALESRAGLYKQAFPGEYRVRVTAEGDVPMQTLVSTMDALAGSTCKIGKTISANVEPPDDCLFWQPIVEGQGS